MPAALPPDHDDHHGGAPRRRCRWRSAPAPDPNSAARSGITIVGGLLVEPAAHALHDPGDLSRVRPAGAAPARPAGGRERAAGTADGGPRSRRRDPKRHCVSISEPFIRRPVATSLLTAALCARRHARLPLAAGRAAAAGRVPDHLGSAACPARARRRWPRRSPRRSNAVRAHRRRHRDDLDEPLGSTTITLQFDLNRNIDAAARDVQAAINAARGQLPAEPAEQSDLPQGQSGRRADHDPGADLRPVTRPGCTTRPPRSWRRSCRRSKASAR